MNKIDHGVVSVTLLCILLGTIIGIQFRTVRAQATTVDIGRVNELSIKVNALEEENKKLQGVILESEKKINDYEKSISNESDSFRLAVEENNKLKNFAGLTTLSGRGITVSINDSPKAGNDQNGVSTEAFLVHAEDILSIINELNVAGAEAISINGQRIVSNSSVRCAGSVVNINGVKVAAPFVITAIGDSDIMESALIFPGGVVDALKPWGIEIVIKKLDQVEVSAYTQGINYKEAKPIAN